MAMVAIMAMASGAFAQTATVTTSTNTSIGGTSFGHAITIFGCAAVVGSTTTCPAMSAASIATFVFQSTGGSGTGLTGGMPTQVAYSAGTGLYVAGTADSTTGYLLNSNLYGMCGVAGCPLYVPYAAVTNAASTTLAALYFSQGGGLTIGGVANPASTIPSGTGNFDQAVFTTALVSGFADTAAGGSGMVNELSQYTKHQSGEGDFIDQRLAFTVVGANTVTAGSPSGVLNQAVAISGGPATTQVDAGAVDSTWKGNVDPYFTLDPTNSVGTQYYTNTGEIAQQVGDNMAGNTNGVDIGSYGQVFNNTVTVTQALASPGLPNAPQLLYVPATGPTIPTPLP